MNKKQIWLQNLGYGQTSSNYWLKEVGIHIDAIGVSADGMKAAIVSGPILAVKIPAVLREFDVVYTWGNPPECWLSRKQCLALEGSKGAIPGSCDQLSRDTFPREYKPFSQTRVNIEAFRLISIQKSVTPDFLAGRLGIKRETAASWLSKWKTLGYLKTVKVAGGHKAYGLGDKDWTELTGKAE